jgi:branched-chain amino acid transport system permease protein
MNRYRAPALFVGIVALTLGVNLAMGTPFTVRLLVEATAYGLIALGLNVQFGYGGLFNFGVMGFVMLGGFASVFISFPRNEAFWTSDGPVMLLRALGAFIAGVVLVWGARKLPLKGAARGTVIVLAWIVAYIAYRTQLDPAAAYIEKTSGWIGGLGLYPVLGWAFGGLLAGVVAYFVGKIALGLRSDYLAIATIGISEIIRALIKNADWLTRGTQNVTPVPWPTPLPQDLQEMGVSITDSFITGRLMFLALTGTILIVALFLIQRAYRGPWGRMMRAIRDNFIAAG